MRQYLWPALRSQSRTNALRPILLLHSFRFVGLAFLVPESSRRICRQPTRVRLRTVILRLRSLLAGDRGAAEQTGNHPGLGVQPSRHRRPAPCLLRRQSHGRWPRAGHARCGLLHSNRLGTTPAHQPLCCLPAPVSREPPCQGCMIGMGVHPKNPREAGFGRSFKPEKPRSL